MSSPPPPSDNPAPSMHDGSVNTAQDNGGRTEAAEANVIKSNDSDKGPPKKRARSPGRKLHKDTPYMGGEFAAFYSHSFAPYERMIKPERVSHLDDKPPAKGSSVAQDQGTDDDLRLPSDTVHDGSSFPAMTSESAAVATVTPGETSQENGGT